MQTETVLTFLAMLGCGLMSGFFFAFSAGVMRALGRLEPEAGIAAMQAINVAVLNRLFLPAFFGTGLLCLAVAVLSLADWPAPGGVARLAGSLAYLVGTFLVTVAFNVPRNDALAAVDAASPAAAGAWSSYLGAWTVWNHVRTAAALAATALLALGL